MKKIFDKQFLKDATMVLLGSVMFAAALNVFLLPKGITVGGVSGIATALNILFSLPVGVIMIALNLPLLIANAIVYGIKFIYRTFVGIVLTSVMTDLLWFLPHSESEPLICAIFGGACMGVGLGIMFSCGVTTGGTDLAACLLKKKFPGMPTSALMLITDVVIIFSCAIALGNFEGVVFSLIAGVANALTIEFAQGGLLKSKLMIVICNDDKAISDVLLNQVDRGVTLLECRGAYSGQDKKMLICAVKRGELFFAKKSVLATDPTAFIIITDAASVHGEGFEFKGI